MRIILILHPLILKDISRTSCNALKKGRDCDLSTTPSSFLVILLAMP